MDARRSLFEEIRNALYLLKQLKRAGRSSNQFIHVGSSWKIQDRRQTKNTDNTETKHNPEKANNAKHSKTKLAWFSRLLRHSASKRGELILQRSRAHSGPVDNQCEIYEQWQP